LKNSKKNEWFGEKFFNKDYLEFYEPQVTDERTLGECDFIEEALRLKPEHRILDHACGQGRHAIELARRGYNITGYDYSSILLKAGRDWADKEGVEVKFVHGDMRDLPYKDEYDRIYNYFTAFGYFSDEDNEKSIALIARALKTGGLFLIDTISREWIIREFMEKTWEERDGRYHVIERVLDLEKSRIYNSEHIIDGEKTMTRHHDLRLYSLTKMVKMFENSKMKVREVFGSLEKEPYTITSKRMILIAEKP